MIGTANSSAAAGSTNRTVITSSARLVFVSDTIAPIMQHPRDPGVLRRPFGQGDGGGDGEHPDHVLGGGRQERRRPVARPEARGHADEHLDDPDRDDRAEQELGEVEAELDRSLVAVDDQGQSRPDQAGRDELGRARRRRSRRRPGSRSSRTSARFGRCAGGRPWLRSGRTRPPAPTRAASTGACAGGPAGSSSTASATATVASTTVSAQTRAVPVVEEPIRRSPSRSAARFSWRAITMACSA